MQIVQSVQKSRGALKILHKFVNYVRVCICVRLKIVWVCVYVWLCVLKKSISSLRISPLRAKLLVYSAPSAAAAAALGTGRVRYTSSGSLWAEQTAPMEPMCRQRQSCIPYITAAKRTLPNSFPAAPLHRNTRATIWNTPLMTPT